MDILNCVRVCEFQCATIVRQHAIPGGIAADDADAALLGTHSCSSVQSDTMPPHGSCSCCCIASLFYCVVASWARIRTWHFTPKHETYSLHKRPHKANTYDCNEPHHQCVYCSSFQRATGGSFRKWGVLLKVCWMARYGRKTNTYTQTAQNNCEYDIHLAAWKRSPCVPNVCWIIDL